MRRATCIIFSLFLVSAAGCSSSPTAADQNMQSAAGLCKERLGEVILGARTPDPGTVRIVAATIMTLGLNVAAYETCKTHFESLLPPTSGFGNDLYHSEDGSFSVILPGLLAKNEQSTFDIAHTTTGSWENTTFIPKQSDGVIYGISLNRQLSLDDVPMSTQQYADRLLDSRMRAQFDTISGVELAQLHKEEITIGGGIPAVVDVFGFQGASSSGKTDVQKDSNPTGYVIYYIVKSKDMSAVLSIVWRGQCSKCVSGPESEIRRMNPGITKFVESFRFTDKEVLSHGE